MIRTTLALLLLASSACAAGRGTVHNPVYRSYTGSNRVSTAWTYGPPMIERHTIYVPDYNDYAIKPAPDCSPKVYNFDGHKILITPQK